MLGSTLALAIAVAVAVDSGWLHAAARHPPVIRVGRPPRAVARPGEAPPGCPLTPPLRRRQRGGWWRRWRRPSPRGRPRGWRRLIARAGAFRRPIRPADAPTTAAATAAVLVVLVAAFTAGPSASRPCPTRQDAPRARQRNVAGTKLDRRVPVMIITVGAAAVAVAAAVVVGRAPRVVLVGHRDGHPLCATPLSCPGPSRQRRPGGGGRLSTRRGGGEPVPVRATAPQRSPPRRKGPLLGTPPGGAPRR